MAIIKAAEIENKHPGTGRMIGRIMADYVSRGDTIDFAGFESFSNSFADEFVKTFIEKYGKEAFQELNFVNTSELLKTLLKRAFVRRTLDDKREKSPIDFTRWEQLRVSSLFA
ncbi:MAG: STAS-like domain-containing protein [Candidatus Desulfofervidaceae bacterium]|nr:STAS-like domain-containing protein [Candidatus Desulfofervidaceae bacterium]